MPRVMRPGVTLLLMLLPLLVPLHGRSEASIVRRFIYQPDPLPSQLDWGALEAPEEIVVRTLDGLEIKGFRWPARKANHSTLVFFHGNAGNRYEAGLMAAPLRRPDVEIIVASYRGFGGNPGTPSETGLYRDGKAFLDYASIGRPQRLYLFGFSLGAAVALHLAAERQVSAVVTLGAFSRLCALAPRWARFLLPDKFDNVAAVSGLRIPHLLMHGSMDEIVPASEARKLSIASGGRSHLLLLDGAPHYIDLAGVARTMWTRVEPDRFPVPEGVGREAGKRRMSASSESQEP